MSAFPESDRQPPQATALLWANRRHDGRPRIVVTPKAIRLFEAMRRCRRLVRKTMAAASNVPAAAVGGRYRTIFAMSLPGGTRASRIRARRTPTKGVPQRIYPDREGQEMWKTLDAASREASARRVRPARPRSMPTLLNT